MVFLWRLGNKAVAMTAKLDSGGALILMLLISTAVMAAEGFATFCIVSGMRYILGLTDPADIANEKRKGNERGEGREKMD